VAVVECEAGVDIAQLPHWVGDKLARFQQPVHWLVLPVELKNGGIKISRRALQQWVYQSLKG
jgi:O-succinylbenzoic acid--CoA ligase